MVIKRQVIITKCIRCDKIMEQEDFRKAEEGDGIEEIEHIFWDICSDCEQKHL